MTQLKSHPELQLHEHISEVALAADSIIQWHSNNVVTSEVKELIRKVILLHDMGKATRAFQEYIEDPRGYTGDPMDKAHTPMSMLLTLLLSKEENWEALETIMVSAIVFGHHRALPSEERLRDIGSGKLAKTLKRQISFLETEGLIQSQ